MTKKRDNQTLDASAYELLVAEEELILHAQMLIQRLLNERKISQRQLADKMGVSDAYVSQMLGLSPRNLTLRTIARVMNALGAKATMVLDSEGVVGNSIAQNDDAETVTAIAIEGDADAAKAVASRVATGQFAEVWSSVAQIASAREKKRKRGEARAYAAFDANVQPMEPVKEMAEAA